MKARSPEIIAQQAHHTLLSTQVDNHMFGLGLCCIASMLSITLGLFFLS